MIQIFPRLYIVVFFPTNLLHFYAPTKMPNLARNSRLHAQTMLITYLF